MILEHEYDRPELGPVEFLLAIMHDPTLSIHERLEAARLASPYVPVLAKDDGRLFVLPVMPTPDEWREYILMMRIWESGHTLTEVFGDDCDKWSLSHIQAKGHA